MKRWIQIIRQFDVIPNPLRTGRADRPFLLSVQHRFLDAVESRVLAPLAVVRAFDYWPRLNPALHVVGRQLYLVPTDLVVLSLKSLGTPIAKFEADRDRIIAALGLVVTGI